MAAPKGTRPPNAGKGRPPGVPNKATGAVRNVFAVLLEANEDKLQMALDEVYQSDKARWLALMLDLSEFARPKLARTELAGTGELGGVHLRVSFVSSEPQVLP